MWLPKRINEYLNASVSRILFLPISTLMERKGFVPHPKTINISWPIYISYWLLFRWQHLKSHKQYESWKEIICIWVMDWHKKATSTIEGQDGSCSFDLRVVQIIDSRTQHTSTEPCHIITRNRVRTYILPTFYKHFLFSANKCNKTGDWKEKYHKNLCSFRMIEWVLARFRSNFSQNAIFNPSPPTYYKSLWIFHHFFLW